MPQQTLIITVTGNGTITVPSGITQYDSIELWSSGGNGAQGDGASTGGGAGGGGMWGIKSNYAVTPGTPINYRVAPAGDTGAGSGSWFVTSGTIVCPPGGNASGVTNGGMATGATGCDSSRNGGTGGYDSGPNGNGGGGGGGGDSGSAGGDGGADGTAGTAGTGGVAGPGGAGGTSGNPGAPATKVGGGGGGGDPNHPGGAGFRGQIRLKWTPPTYFRYLVSRLRVFRSSFRG